MTEPIKLHEIIKDRLDGQTIRGNDNRDYTLLIIGNGTLSIYVRSIQDPTIFGWFPELRVIGEEKLLNAEVVDFTRVPGNGLYKRAMQMIFDAIPSGTKFIDSFKNCGDIEFILRYIKEHKPSLNSQEVFERTCIGHVFQTAGFEVEVRYGISYDGHETSTGIDALIAFGTDYYEKGIYPSRNPKDLFLVGTKP